MAVVAVTTTMVAGVEYTHTTASSADWGSVSNSTYFYDLTDKKVYYKDSIGDILQIFSKTDLSVLEVASQAAPLTPDFITYDMYVITAQSLGLIIGNPASDPTIPKGFMFRITDNGTSQTISWPPDFVSFGDTLPTATTAGKTTYVSGITNPTTGKYDVISVKTEA
jgi:hypothetical protein